MLNKDEIEGISKATAEILKAVPVYDDAVKPVAQEIGKTLKTLGGVINVALAPLSAMVYGYNVISQELKNRLESRLSKTSPENIIVPKLQIVGPLLDKYKYVHEDENLSEMYINLLASSMDKDTAQKAHPSFVNVISELSPDEARLLKVISREKILPKLDLKIKVDGGKGYIHVYSNFTLLGEKAGLQYSDLTPTYLSNLERLNIINCGFGAIAVSYSNKENYKLLEESELLKNLLKTYDDQEGQLETSQGVINITDFGKLFISAVIDTV